MSMRFFDDDNAQQGLYIPPFSSVIESRQDLLDNPVSTVLIMSRTFGDRIRRSLRDQNYRGEILTIEDLAAG